MKIKFFYGLILILTSLSLGAEPAESSPDFVTTKTAIL